MSAAECRSGPESGRPPSSGQYAACVMPSHPAGGPNAPDPSPVSTRQSSAIACLSPDPASMANAPPIIRVRAGAPSGRLEGLDTQVGFGDEPVVVELRGKPAPAGA